MPKLSDDEYIYQCECRSSHYVRFSVVDDGYLWIEDFYGSNLPIKNRLKMMWQVLRGKECIRSEVVFNAVEMDKFAVDMLFIANMLFIAKRMEDMK